ncbi:MAG: UDP-galactose transporter [Piccolia ochrophora]|nr:MAG: UDP-galactose transporter [Piccolia ochrophora]
MARQKTTPIRREPSSEIIERAGDSPLRNRGGRNLDRKESDLPVLDSFNVASKPTSAPEAPAKQAGLTQLIICIGGIYASFLSWAVLQERITTTTYGPPSSPEMFRYPIFLNTVQSLFALLTGYIYLLITTPRASYPPALLPSRAALAPLGLVALTSSLASPFGYASLAHIDYVTFILAKSCKLLPVMALHLTIFRTRYPLYKYAVVFAVTAGVAVFTLHHPGGSSSKRKSPSSSSGDDTLSRNQPWGLLLLSINLLFDGLTNSTQDYIFRAFRPFSGPQMMAAQNLLNTGLTLSYMWGAPHLARTGVGAWLGMDLGSAAAGGEWSAAMAFVRRNPGVGRDVLAFAACGAVGQVFIFYTLAHFSSLLLVTVTVTRKMLTMMLSVVMFGHRLSGMQWVGVSLVFGGVGAEGWIARREKRRKDAAAAPAVEEKVEKGVDGKKEL